MGALLHRDYSLRQSQYAKYLEDSEWFVQHALYFCFAPLSPRRYALTTCAFPQDLHCANIYA